MADEWIQRANNNLQKAKQNGGNEIIFGSGKNGINSNDNDNKANDGDNKVNDDSTSNNASARASNASNSSELMIRNEFNEIEEKSVENVKVRVHTCVFFEGVFGVC